MIVVAGARTRTCVDAPRELLEPHDRQRREHRRARAAARYSRSGTGAEASSRAQRAPAREHQHRQRHADDEQRAAQAERDHEHRREQRAEPGRQPVRALDDAERARQHGVGGEPLHERQPGDLHHRVADAEHDEADHRDADRPAPRPARSAARRSARLAIDERRSRCARARSAARAPAPPITPPTPQAEFSQPTPAAPSSSSSSATSTTSTSIAPSTSVLTPSTPTTSRSRGSARDGAEALGDLRRAAAAGQRRRGSPRAVGGDARAARAAATQERERGRRRARAPTPPTAISTPPASGAGQEADAVDRAPERVAGRELARLVGQRRAAARPARACGRCRSR